MVRANAPASFRIDYGYGAVLSEQKIPWISEVTDCDDERSTNVKDSPTAAITMNDWRVDGKSSSESAFPQWQQYRY